MSDKKHKDDSDTTPSSEKKNKKKDKGKGKGDSSNATCFERFAYNINGTTIPDELYENTDLTKIARITDFKLKCCIRNESSGNKTYYIAVTIDDQTLDINEDGGDPPLSDLDNLFDWKLLNIPFKGEKEIEFCLDYLYLEPGKKLWITYNDPSCGSAVKKSYFIGEINFNVTLINP